MHDGTSPSLPYCKRWRNQQVFHTSLLRGLAQSAMLQLGYAFDAREHVVVSGLVCVITEITLEYVGRLIVYHDITYAVIFDNSLQLHYLCLASIATAASRIRC